MPSLHLYFFLSCPKIRNSHTKLLSNTGYKDRNFHLTDVNYVKTVPDSTKLLSNTGYKDKSHNLHPFGKKLKETLICTNTLNNYDLRYVWGVIITFPDLPFWDPVLWITLIVLRSGGLVCMFPWSLMVDYLQGDNTISCSPLSFSNFWNNQLSLVARKSILYSYNIYA